jgi:hypothetical protein
MPIPLGIAAAGALTGGVGLAQGIAGAVKTKADKANEKRLRELEELKENSLLGLTGTDWRVQERSLLAPVRSAAGETRARAEQIGAGRDMTGADLSRLRTEQTTAIAGAGERAALTLEQKNLLKIAAQEQEIRSREARMGERADQRKASVFEGLSDAAGAAGAVAGATPEALRAAGLAGASIYDTKALSDGLEARGITGEAKEIILGINPDRLPKAMFNVENGVVGGKPEAALRAAFALMDEELAGDITFAPADPANITVEEA